MTGALQTYARKTSIAIDTLTFATHVVKEDPTEAPENGVYVYGMFLEGAGWDTEAGQLCESTPGVLFHSMPHVWMEPITIDAMDTEGRYTCPFYKTSRRAGTLSTTGHSTNFVAPLYLPMPEGTDEAHWVRRGVALLSQLDE